MSISAMKQALEALEFAGDLIAPITENCQCQICLAHTALEQAIAEAENQDPIAWLCEADLSRSGDWKWSLCFVRSDKDCFRNWEPLFTTPVHASDISEKDVHISDKYRHEWIGLDPEMMRNTPIEFNRGALWAERYLKEKNT